MKNKTKSKPKIVSVEQYAELCGVSKTIIYKRLEKGEIKPTSRKDYSGQLIDVQKYPPVAAKKRGRPAYEG